MEINRAVLGKFINDNKENAVKAMKHRLYDEALILTYGNVSEAARILGVSRSALNNYANKWQPKNKTGE